MTSLPEDSATNGLEAMLMLADSNGLQAIADLTPSEKQWCEGKEAAMGRHLLGGVLYRQEYLRAPCYALSRPRDLESWSICAPATRYGLNLHP